jgi:hypothetical protein
METGMSVASAAVSVTTSATALNAADNTSPQSIEVYNNDADPVFWGGSNVTTTNGVPIAAGTSRGFDLQPGETVYGICEAGTADVRVGRIGVG